MLAKRLLRKEVKSILATLTSDYIDQKSCSIMDRVFEMVEYCQAEYLSVYLSMTHEVNTTTLVEHAFHKQKIVHIPMIVGKSSESMVMLKVSTITQLQSFPMNSWGIREPSLDFLERSVDGTSTGLISLVLVPGVAFDSSCGRLGHGKGYYDSFLVRLTAQRLSMNLPPPITIGLALDEQIVDEIPLEPHDQMLDFVVTPTRIFASKACNHVPASINA